MYLERPVFLTVFFAFVEIKGAKKQRGSTDMGYDFKEDPACFYGSWE